MSDDSHDSTDSTAAKEEVLINEAPTSKIDTFLPMDSIHGPRVARAPGILVSEEKALSRVVAFIDGFNLYHALDQRVKYRAPGSEKTQIHQPYHQYKWLDLKKLSQCFLKTDEILADVYYFTAHADWNPEKVRRHQLYIKALENIGVKPVYGVFRKKEVYCTNCKTKFIKHEEKRTDVNIAIHLLGLAEQNMYDRALLVTGDSDLIPAVQWVRKQYSEKKVSVIVPIGRKVTKHLQAVANDHSKIKESHLRASQFERIIELNDGGSISSPYSSEAPQ